MSSYTLSNIKPIAVISLPRLTFSENQNSLLEIAKMKIPITYCTGAYWHKGMQKCFDYAIESGYTHVLTVDYDSIFTSQSAMMLLTAAGLYQLDAVAGMMAGREGLDKLYTGESTVVNGNLVQVDTAHFGLTVISTAVLADIGHTWINSCANIDPDIFFWKCLQASDYKAYIHRQIHVGHLELRIKWPNGDYQGVDDYHERGRR